MVAPKSSNDFIAYCCKRNGKDGIDWSAKKKEGLKVNWPKSN